MLLIQLFTHVSLKEQTTHSRLSTSQTRLQNRARSLRTSDMKSCAVEIKSQTVDNELQANMTILECRHQITHYFSHLAAITYFIKSQMLKVI